MPHAPPPTPLPVHLSALMPWDIARGQEGLVSELLRGASLTSCSSITMAGECLHPCTPHSMCRAQAPCTVGSAKHRSPRMCGRITCVRPRHMRRPCVSTPWFLRRPQLCTRGPAPLSTAISYGCSSTAAAQAEWLARRKASRMALQMRMLCLQRVSRLQRVQLQCGVSRQIPFPIGNSSSSSIGSYRCPKSVYHRAQPTSSPCRVNRG